MEYRTEESLSDADLNDNHKRKLLSETPPAIRDNENAILIKIITRAHAKFSCS